MRCRLGAEDGGAGARSAVVIQQRMLWPWVRRGAEEVVPRWCMVQVV